MLNSVLNTADRDFHYVATWIFNPSQLKLFGTKKKTFHQKSRLYSRFQLFSLTDVSKEKFEFEPLFVFSKPIYCAFLVRSAKKRNSDPFLCLGSQDVKVIRDNMPKKTEDEKDIAILDNIGNGTFGEVFKGNWNGTDVALKKLKDKNVGADDFVNEAKALLYSQFLFDFRSALFF